MKALEGLSAACCNVPPIIAKDYDIKGTYETIGGTTTYVTGPLTASTAVLYIFDIFGFSNQALQGADILATGNTHNHYQVFVPDFFAGTPADITWYPPDDDRKEKALTEWWSTRHPHTVVSKIPSLLEQFELYNPNIKRWAVAGFCWGGKVVSLTTQSNTLFAAAASSSPARMDPSDAAKITVPICILSSEEESATEVKAFTDALVVEHYVEEFADQKHGWMTARGNLEDETIRKAYQRGYQAMLDFLNEHL
ncbi:putative AIM2 family [Hyphodiscus hymeniophilus]|uniref:AIM2 family n=1 Tax=Hyphodiscus hymeniophilus TaxID=353542 RepID=A0A9P6VNM8_9HELO|nr:putative AIM2 family [Hyphodiscus hymeniophilus]